LAAGLQRHPFFAERFLSVAKKDTVESPDKDHQGFWLTALIKA
jgi:hypothetical protein